MNKWLSIFICLICTLTGGDVYAELRHFTSSSNTSRVALLELYTSEGCSSCPPAEKLLGELEERGFPASDVIPIALHVDYWDYIGWKDEFADPEFTARQRRLGNINRLNTIYTPQFVLNGQDLRPIGLMAHRLPAINKQPAKIQIQLDACFSDANQLKVKWATEPGLTSDNNLFLVVTESNLQTKVEAGENRGKTLAHHHVARYLKKISDNASSGTVSIEIKNEFSLQRLDLIAFVENKNGRVLQALKLPLR